MYDKKSSKILSFTINSAKVLEIDSLCTWFRSAVYQTQSAILQNSIRTGLDIGLYVRLPEAEHEPAKLRQGVCDFFVALDIAGELLFPVRLPRCNLLARIFLMSPRMPKIAVHENGDLLSCQGDVRGAGKRSPVFPIANPPVPKRLSEQDLRPCVTALDALHRFAPAFRRENVHLMNNASRIAAGLRLGRRTSRADTRRKAPRRV